MSTNPRKGPAADALVAGGVVVVLIALVAAVFMSGLGETLYPPRAATAQASEIRGLYDIVFAFALAIFVIVEALILWSVFRYRRRKGDDALPAQTHGNNLVEVIWTLIPTVIVIFLFIVSWQTLDSIEKVSDEPDVRIHAVAGQFQWTFEYLDESGRVVATQKVPTAENGGGMAVPVGRSIQVTLDSPDVIHAFYVPRFLFKRDVIPGQTNIFEFTVNADEAGRVFRGQCAELCGAGHRVMLFSVLAMDPAAYDSWLTKLIADSTATPTPQPSLGPAEDIGTVIAKNIAYDVKSLEAPADTAFSIEFQNTDVAGVLHDIDIRAADGTVLADTPTIDGGASTTYTYAGMAAGTYTFICSIHPVPSMTGTLTVK